MECAAGRAAKSQHQCAPERRHQCALQEVGMLGLEQLADLLDKYRPMAQARVKEFDIGGRQFAFNSAPSIMGVINLSPDSWYRESVCLTTEMAVRRGKVLHEQGAAIVDIGAESTLAHSSRADDALQ